MVDRRVGVQQSATPDRHINNELVTDGNGDPADRQYVAALGPGGVALATAANQAAANSAQTAGNLAQTDGSARSQVLADATVNTVQINYNAAVSPDTAAVYKARYICTALVGTALTGQWRVSQLTWSREAANVYRRTQVSVQTTSLLTAGSDAPPWPAVKTRLDALTWTI